MKSCARLIGWCSVVLLAACTQIGNKSDAASKTMLDLPDTYQGVIPCADCPGIDLTITLQDDGLYKLRRTYMEAEDGANMSFYRLGAWHRQGDTVVLFDGEGAPRNFRIKAGTLTMLDAQGEALASDLNYMLNATAGAEPMNGPFRMTGEFGYFDDAPVFAPCGHPRALPVAKSGAYPALEQAYSRSEREQRTHILTQVVGDLVQRSARPESKDNVVVVEAVNIVNMADSCSVPTGG